MTDSINSLISTYTAQYGGDNVLKNTPLVSGAYKSFTDAMKLGTDSGKNDGSMATDIGSLASDATGFASDAVSAAADPLNFLISKGLGFLENVFTPLKEELHLVTGNPDTLSASAKKFDGVANSLNQLAAQVEQTAATGGQNWQGQAATSAGTQVGATKQSITDTATYAGYLASLLQISGMVMQAAYDIVNGIIASVVEKVVITWIAAQAAAIPSAGASEVAATGATVAEVAEGVTQASGKVEETTSLLTKIINLLKKIMAWIKEAGSNLRHPLQTFMKKDGDKAVGAGAKALDGVATNGKSASQIFTEAIGKNLSPAKIAETAQNKALNEIGLPDKDKLLDPSKIDKATDWAKTGANLIAKPLGLDVQGGQALGYAISPGAATASQDSSSGPTTTAPTSGGSSTSGGSVEPIPNWPGEENGGENAEPA